MLKKMISCLTFCLVCQQLCAQQNSLIEQPSPVGRYQLTVATNKTNTSTQLFLLDTVTGTVWMNEIDFGRSGAWKILPRLPLFPPFPAIEELEAKNQ